MQAGLELTARWHDAGRGDSTHRLLTIQRGDLKRTMRQYSAV